MMPGLPIKEWKKSDAWVMDVGKTRQRVGFIILWQVSRWRIISKLFNDCFLGAPGNQDRLTTSPRSFKAVKRLKCGYK